MWGFLNEIIFEEIVKVWKPKAPHFVYRDEMNKKPAPGKLKRSSHGVSKPLSKDCDAISKPLLQGEGKNFERRSQGGVDEKGVIRVKVLMTKQEAARLLSKCKNGGRLEFKDAARELEQIPVNRVNIVGHSTSRDKVLESIPEEL